MNGIINIRKEKGFTSHDVVAKLRGICRQKKIGHTGTLDPDAEGVLPVCLGSATKVCDLLTDWQKTYRAVLQLGVITDTQDMTGTVLEEREVSVTEEEIRRVIAGFLGDYDQVPPMYSALKVNGRKLYELARKGQVVERKPRRVTIYSIDVEQINPEQNQVTMTVECSKGTYIRTLCEDIGTELGCGGAMAALTRTAVGIFRLENAISLSQAEEYAAAGMIEEQLTQADALFAHYGRCEMLPDEERFVRNGNPFQKEQCKVTGNAEQIRVYGEQGEFLALYHWNEEKDSVSAI